MKPRLTIVLEPQKPRNPLARAARGRKAGAMRDRRTRRQKQRDRAALLDSLTE